MQFGTGRKRIIFAPPCALRQGGPRALHQVRKAVGTIPHFRISQLHADRAKLAAGKKRGSAVPKLNRAGVNIYSGVHGSGPPLILTHGYSSTSAMWQGQI